MSDNSAPEKKSLTAKALHRLPSLLNECFGAWLLLLKLSVPAIILMRLILWFDLTPQVAKLFEPFMGLMGLPPEAAFIWVAAMLANVYAGLLVFMAALPIMGPLSVVQATILGSIMLIAHNLLMEGQVCRGAGVSFLRVTIFRIFAALLYGVILHQSALIFGWGAAEAPLMLDLSGGAPVWTEWLVAAALILVARGLWSMSAKRAGTKAAPAFKAGAALAAGLAIWKLVRAVGAESGAELFSAEAVPSWGAWFVSSCEQLLLILAIIVLLMVMMGVFKQLGITTLAGRLLSPPLKLVGIGESALMITIIGNVLGLAYGGGLIIADSRSGRVAAADVYGSIVFMAVCHSLLEDSILLASLGGSLWGLVVGRLFFALALTAVITRLARLPLTRNIFVGAKYKY